MEAGTGELSFSAYRRHHAEQERCVADLLGELRDRVRERALRVAVCGSGGRPLADRLGLDFVQEVVANAIAVRHLHPEARTAIELGGQDAKIVFFHHDPVTEQLIASDMRMNGVCAGGTGAFIDEIASLLEIPVGELNAWAERGRFVHHVSGRCGVFAKTDIQPLLNQGVPKDDLARSTLHAVVRQTIGGLAQGSTITPPVVFEGGPLTFNPYLIRAFAEALGLQGSDVIVPEHPEVIVAYGCARALETLPMPRSEPVTVGELLAALAGSRGEPTLQQERAARPLFADGAERAAFQRRHRLPPPVEVLDGGPGRLEVFLGIDAGSTTSKFVLLGGDGRLLYSFYGNNRGRPLEILRDALLELREAAAARGVQLDIRGVGTTGYGEQLVAAAFHADHHAVETVAHARAALHYQPDASFVLDIGGQDMKAIFLDGGIITAITLNEACSSGCGAFIETFADSLGVPVRDVSESAFRSSLPAQLGSRCTVFMRSSVITEQRNGKSPEDILAGLCSSVVQNVFTKVIRVHNLDRLGERIVVQGGTFRNDAVLRALELHTGRSVTRAPYPELMGAIGIALLTRERLGHGEPHASTFIGLDALETFGYSERSGQRCPFCQNHCDRTIVRFSDGSHYVRGNRCERGAVIGDPKEATVRDRVREVNRRIRRVPDLVAERARLLQQSWLEPGAGARRNTTIGIPLVLEAWLRLPFWKALFASLGFTVRVSGQSSFELFEAGLPTIPSDTVCFPAKLAHGHVRRLLEQGVDRIFMPIVITSPSESTEVAIDRPCAILHGYPAVIRTNCTEDGAVPIDTPTFVWDTPGMRERQLVRYLEETFAVPRAEARAALAAGLLAQERFRDALRRRGAEVIEGVRREGGFAVVLAARPYHSDPLVHHGLPGHFVQLGVPVLPADAVPVDSVASLDLQVPVHSNVQATLYAATRVVARMPWLELAQITSFGCGHDAVVTDELQRILQSGGKQLLHLKLDESDVQGPMRLRITSFVDTVRRRGPPSPPPRTDRRLPVFSREDRTRRTIYIPNLSQGFSRLFEAVMSDRGYGIATLPLADARAVELGKLYLHNDICFPAQLNIGEFLRHAEREGLEPGEVAFGIHQNCKGCRAGHYAALARQALDQAGFDDTPVVTSGDDGAELHPGARVDARMKLRLVQSLAVLDGLEDMLRSTRPYEVRPGEAQQIFDRSLAALCRSASSGQRAVLRVLSAAVEAFNGVPVVPGPRRPLVMVLGEILVAVHRTANYDLEAYLERQGMEVLGTRLSDFFHKTFIRALEERRGYGAVGSVLSMLVDRLSDRVFERAREGAEDVLEGYVRYRPRVSARELQAAAGDLMEAVHICGEGWLIPGEILHAADQGVHSFVIAQPFGCMPNHIGGRGMIKAIKQRHPHVQVLPLDFDPDTSVGNIENRLQMLVMNARDLESRRSRAEAGRGARRGEVSVPVLQGAVGNRVS